MASGTISTPVDSITGFLLLQLIRVTGSNYHAHEEGVKSVQAMRSKMSWGSEISSADTEAYINSTQMYYYLIYINIQKKIEESVLPEIYDPSTTVGAISVFAGESTNKLSSAKVLYELGNFIIAESLRGKGIGHIVLTLLKDHFKMENAGLISALRTEKLYNQYGFHEEDRVSHFSFETWNRESRSTVAALELISAEDKAHLIAYDAKVSETHREDLLSRLIDNSAISFVAKTVSIGSTAVILKGYGLARKLQKEGSYRISIYADDNATTCEILHALIKNLQNLALQIGCEKIEVFLTTLSAKETLIHNWLKDNLNIGNVRLGAEKHAVMFLKDSITPLATSLEKCYALLTLEAAP